MSPRIEVAIEAEDWEKALPDLEALVGRVAACCFDELRMDADDAEISVLFCDDATIRALNATWRKQDKATNVLSFPVISPATAPGAPRLLGDVALAFETVQREAAEQGKSFAAHVAHLVAHGLLHLLGFDHEEEDEAERMEMRERAVLARLGVADPYRVWDSDPV